MLDRLRDLLWPKPAPVPVPPAPRPTPPRPQPKPPSPPPVPPAPAPSPDPDFPEFALSLLKLHNAKRQQPLQLNKALMRAAQVHASWMATVNKLQHDGPQRSDQRVRAQAAGYRGMYVTENIGWGASEVESVFHMWWTSPPHKKNILDPGAVDCGFGVAVTSAGQPYWCAVFARPDAR